MKIQLVNKLICNKKEVDIYVRDAFGKEYIIYPGEKKRVCVLKKGGQTGKKSGGRDGQFKSD